jgi:hypothetical protein
MAHCKMRGESLPLQTAFGNLVYGKSGIFAVLAIVMDQRRLID